MSKAQRTEYAVTRLAEIFTTAYVRDGMPDIWAAAAASQALDGIVGRIGVYRAMGQLN